MIATEEKQATAFDTHHDDVIHDAKIDFNGRRIATASSDRTIRIFKINKDETESLLSVLSGHSGPVWQVAWANPKFGSILASCAYDGSVFVWQEQPPKQPDGPSTWIKVKEHRVHDQSVNSISFAPHQYGLHLACASSDGKVSVLSFSDDGEWKDKVWDAHESGCNAVSWCPAALPCSLLAVDLPKNNEELPIGPMRLASGGCDNLVKLWKFNDESGEFLLERKLSGHSDWVRDLCFAPNMGALPNSLVSCSQDCTAVQWKEDPKTGEWGNKVISTFPDTLWRVNFSEYGNLLAISCGDNTVTIWRESPKDDGLWMRVGRVDEKLSDEALQVEPQPITTTDATVISPSILDNRHVRRSSVVSEISVSSPYSDTLINDFQSQTFESVQVPQSPVRVPQSPVRVPQSAVQVPQSPVQVQQQRPAPRPRPPTFATPVTRPVRPVRPTAAATAAPTFRPPVRPSTTAVRPQSQVRPARPAATGFRPPQSRPIHQRTASQGSLPAPPPSYRPRPARPVSQEFPVYQQKPVTSPSHFVSQSQDDLEGYQQPSPQSYSYDQQPLANQDIYQQQQQQQQQQSTDFMGYSPAVPQQSPEQSNFQNYADQSYYQQSPPEAMTSQAYQSLAELQYVNVDQGQMSVQQKYEQQQQQQLYDQQQQQQQYERQLQQQQYDHQQQLYDQQQQYGQQQQYDQQQQQFDQQQPKQYAQQQQFDQQQQQFGQQQQYDQYQYQYPQGDVSQSFYYSGQN